MKQEKRIQKGLLISIAILSILASSLYIGSVTAFPDNPQTHEYFNKIADMPFCRTPGVEPSEQFWIHGGDCEDRAHIFADYLTNKGEKDVKLMYACKIENETIIHNADGTIGHEFVLWNGRVYSPNLPKDHRFYDTDLKTYEKFLKTEYGYNTVCLDNETVGTSF